ncbi:MAG: flagellar export protein FliJ [Lachnospiraceae bacterium]|nr:flagellar export protein FliJ [Lachnospiraceae bacterium]
MTKFVYKMQNILDIKFKLENQAKTSYANARAKLEEEEEKLRALRAKRTDYEENYRRVLSDVLDIRELNFCMQGMEQIQEAIKNQIVAIHVAEMNLEAAREHLQEVMQERKTHEKLKEYAFDEYVKEVSAEESKEIDELVSYNYGKVAGE